MIHRQSTGLLRFFEIVSILKGSIPAPSMNPGLRRLLVATLSGALFASVSGAVEPLQAHDATVGVSAIPAVSNESVLHSFIGGATDGELPQSKLIMGPSGTLFGTTPTGGEHNLGTVFELTLSGSTWTEKVLYNFSGTPDGANPNSALVMDALGNLYGTTTHGGIYGASSSGYGTFFELSPLAGSWILTGIYSFEGGKDGFYPYNNEGLVRDSSGNFYGTTSQGGLSGLGTAFEIIPPPTGSTIWTKKILHNFEDNATDGGRPQNSLILDTHGNLFGTTFYGGAHGHGTVFELSPNPPNQLWLSTLLYSFGATATDGIEPWCSLVLSATGNLYGTTTVGGLYNGGTIFQVTPGNPSIELILYNFDGATGDGINPFAGLTRDFAGNLYGTTQAGGSYHLGTVFELPLGAPGKPTVLHNFGGTNIGDDGASPQHGALLVDSQGNLYGTTDVGGTHSLGTVFKVTP